MVPRKTCISGQTPALPLAGRPTWTTPLAPGSLTSLPWPATPACTTPSYHQELLHQEISQNSPLSSASSTLLVLRAGSSSRPALPLPSLPTCWHSLSTD